MSIYNGTLSNNFSTQQFNTNKKCNNNNVLTIYKELGKEFIEHFYNTITNNIKDVSHMYQQNTYITHNGVELIGFNQYIEYFKSTLNIHKLEFELKKVDGQPLDKNTLLINIIGKVKANNDNSTITEFSETFILGTFGKNYQITRQIFMTFN